MPFIPHTPESLLARSDSKDPATTCNGITSTGRPCRRALATSPRSSPSPRASPSAIGRVLAVAPAERDRRGTVEAAVFFCWQHKEQAERWGADNGSRGDRQKKKIGEMRGRTSVDTLIDRLGLLEVGDGSPKKVEGRHHRVSREKTGLETRKSGLGPSTKALEQGPRVGAAKPAVPPRKTRRKSRDDGSLIVSLFCCVRSVDPEYLPPPRPRPQSQGNQPPRADCPQMEEAPAAARSLTSSLVNTKPEKAAQPVSIERDQGRASHHSTRPATARVPFPKTAPQRINRPAPHDPPPQTQTQTLLSLIPAALPPHTTSALLSELAKPLPDSADSGYIYIFWLTDAASTPPPSPPTAASLLLQSPPRPPQHPSHDSAPVPDPARTGPNGTTTIILKIGRASNVHRRLNEWSRQCGYAPSLVRYYPPLPSSALSPASSLSPWWELAPPPAPCTPRKVPHVSRVERLIHIELAHRRVKRQCAVCGRGHREWFEVEASREGFRGVDEVVGRWVKWGEERG